LKVKQLGAKKVFCVYDRGIKEAGIAGKIVDNLKAAGLQVVSYDGVKEDPPDTMINEAAQIAAAEKVDAVVGVGGGSTMDTAKGINVLLTNPAPINQYYAGSGKPHQPGKILVLIPTTAGTGSEATNISVVSDTQSQSKKGVLGPAALAALAIVDPELLLGLPPKITAATGMDAFAHAVEALTSEGMNPMSDVLAEKAVALITRNLPISVQDGSNLEARTNMMFASLIAGIAFNDTMPHWGHAIAHALGAKFHIPHGIGCAVALPVAVEFVADAVPEKIRQAGLAMGLTLPEGMPPAELGAVVAQAIQNLNREVGIPSLKEYNVNEAAVEQLAGNVLADDCAMFGPKRASARQAQSMLKKASAY
jgi:alcohol dehydrogenase